MLGSLKEFLLPGVTPPWSNFKTKDLVILIADPDPVVAHTKSYSSFALFLRCACLPSRPPRPPPPPLLNAAETFAVKQCD